MSLTQCVTGNSFHWHLDDLSAIDARLSSFWQAPATGLLICTITATLRATYLSSSLLMACSHTHSDKLSSFLRNRGHRAGVLICLRPLLLLLLSLRHFPSLLLKRTTSTLHNCVFVSVLLRCSPPLLPPSVINDQCLVVAVASVLLTLIPSSYSFWAKVTTQNKSSPAAPCLQAP